MFRLSAWEKKILPTNFGMIFTEKPEGHVTPKILHLKKQILKIRRQSFDVEKYQNVLKNDIQMSFKWP